MFLDKISTLEEYQQFMNQKQRQKLEQLKKTTKMKQIPEKTTTWDIDEFQKDIESSYKKNYSDYQAFLWKSKLMKQEDYPSAFKLIKIEKSEPEITFQEQNLMLNFSPLAYSTKELIHLASSMILQNQFSQQFFSFDLLSQLIENFADHYNIVSYHNFSHGFNLSYILFQSFKADEGLRKIYSEEQKAFCLIAGLAHDINHPGTNNLYEVKLKTQLANLADNDAVLQKMHIRTLFKILKQNPSLDVLTKSTNPLRMKQFITRIILSTDIAKHFKNLDKLKKRMKTKEIDFSEDQDKNLLMENLFHACDIGNPCLEYNCYMNWSALLTYEFNEQAKLEDQNKVQVTKFLVYQGKIDFYEGQKSFLNTIILPLWKELSVQWNGLDKLVKNIETNLQIIDDKINEQKF